MLLSAPPVGHSFHLVFLGLPHRPPLAITRPKPSPPTRLGTDSFPWPLSGPANPPPGIRLIFQTYLFAKFHRLLKTPQELTIFQKVKFKILILALEVLHTLAPVTFSKYRPQSPDVNHLL